MGYFLYPKILSKIKKTLKQKKLSLLSEEPEVFVQKKLRFFHALCKDREGKKVFFKSLLKKERGIKNRFLNEILFLKTMREEKKFPLAKRVPKLLDFSFKKDFPFLVYEFLPGNSKTREDKLSLEEIKEAISLIVLINSTEYNFNFIPKKPLFNFRIFSKTIFSLLKKLKLKKEIETKISKFITKTKEIFKFVKPKLNHGDFSEANLVFYRGKAKIVDWEHVHFRNPLYDFVSFWTKRERERKLIEKEFLKQQKGIEFFFPLFKMALIELSLKNLVFFNEMLKFLEKEKKTDQTLKAQQARKKEIKETLELLKKYL
jgi:hypothetical protein